MKQLLIKILLVATLLAGLAGCAVYPAPTPYGPAYGGVYINPWGYWGPGFYGGDWGHECWGHGGWGHGHWGH
ncbi:MAG: hypothetical protein M0Z81_19155 [Deltaproteobacteria bacterium]|nr:hypothetical protein [Deltaproteobacteria bacterium]